MTIRINDTIRLEQIAPIHAEALFDAVDANREHLSRFLPWVGYMQSVEDFSRYIEACEALQAQQKEISFVIMDGEELVGRIGLHHINGPNKTGAIGYWLTVAAAGRGIITRACKEMLRLGFGQLGLHRIEIKAAVANAKSQAIPEKLGFVKEGILREAELVNNVYLDLCLYSLLKQEWQEK